MSFFLVGFILINMDGEKLIEFSYNEFIRVKNSFITQNDKV